MSDVRKQPTSWVCGAHGRDVFTGLIDFWKTCSVCDAIRERAVSAPVPGCLGCGIRSGDDARAKELEYAVRDLLDDAKLLGTNESHGLYGTCITEIDRRVWDRVRTTWAEIKNQTSSCARCNHERHGRGECSYRYGAPVERYADLHVEQVEGTPCPCRSAGEP